MRLEKETMGLKLKSRSITPTAVAAVVTLGLASLSACGSNDSEKPAAKPSSSAETDASSGTSNEVLAPNPFGGDESWVVYQTNRTTEGIWLIHPDGTEDHEILFNLPDGKLPELPDWSPDGNRIIVTSRGDLTSPDPLYEYDLRTETVRQVFECTAPCLGDDEPVYSPDGSQVAFIRASRPIRNDLPSDCSLWIGDLATGEVRQITHNTKTECDREYNPRWSPDGTQFTYWRQPSWDGKSSITAVFVMNADGTGERRLTDPAMEAGESIWSRDGKWIVFATHPLAQYDAGESHLYRIHPDGTGLEQLTHFSSETLRATQPQFTPDGQWITFTAVTDTSRSLWAIPSDGGDPVEIGEGGIYTHGSWQPHGSEGQQS